MWALNSALGQILIIFCRFLSLPVSISFNQFDSVKNTGIYSQPEGGGNNSLHRLSRESSIFRRLSVLVTSSRVTFSWPSPALAKFNYVCVFFAVLILSDWEIFYAYSPREKSSEMWESKSKLSRGNFRGESPPF